MAGLMFSWPGKLKAKVEASAGSTFVGAITGASSFSGITVAASGSIGYKTGAGGAVTQITSKATGVTLNKICGQITTHAATLNAGVEVTFAVGNTLCATGDVVLACVGSGGTAGAYAIVADTVTGIGFNLTITNLSAGNLGEALVINFIVFKAVAA